MNNLIDHAMIKQIFCTLEWFFFSATVCFNHTFTRKNQSSLSVPPDGHLPTLPMGGYPINRMGQYHQIRNTSLSFISWIAAEVVPFASKTTCLPAYVRRLKLRNKPMVDVVESLVQPPGQTITDHGAH